MCGEDQVQCKKDFEHCIGGCAGDATSNLHYDFSTMIAISDLNPVVVGEDGFTSTHANCTVKTGIIEVPLFEGGDSFATFAVRMQIRSGMTALDNTWCEDNPLSCGVIQRALERSPGLRFVPGVGWRHTYDQVPPSPPPPPTPPPRNLMYGPAPPHPYPPPLTPPPYYIGNTDTLEPFPNVCLSYFSSIVFVACSQMRNRAIQSRLRRSLGWTRAGRTPTLRTANIVPLVLSRNELRRNARKPNRASLA